MSKDYVILVDENDQEIGIMEKQEAHEKALLHRAFSVMIFNNKGELLLQQRAFEKYHSGGLWTNTCCSHPKPGETIEEAAHRRLMEEMGFDCDLKVHQSFIYKAPFDNGLTEHEFDYVLIGEYNQDPDFNTHEVHAFKWISFNDLNQELVDSPEQFTVWFKMILQNYKPV
ncbi:MAG: isopentenyl-diphosphate delta-isomerase [Bacteroidetes bacterium B1(2017)]|nr:MAG: isopentenyl-diphosphate delta-isomerase [Bacteroidetes bacterium B1(2017)]